MPTVVDNRLDAAALLAEAKAETGLSDWGDDSFEERLGLAVDHINTIHMDAAGRKAAAENINWLLTDRLKFMGWAANITGVRSTIGFLWRMAWGVAAIKRYLETHLESARARGGEGLIAELRSAGERAAERCWQLPLWPPYRKQLESPVADLKNVGGRPGGTITASWFLSEFVGKTPWAHLDIAGTAYGEPVAPYQRKGGFGFPTRLLMEWVLARTG